MAGGSDSGWSQFEKIKIAVTGKSINQSNSTSTKNRTRKNDKAHTKFRPKGARFDHKIPDVVPLHVLQCGEATRNAVVANENVAWGTASPWNWSVDPSFLDPVHDYPIDPVHLPCLSYHFPGLFSRNQPLSWRICRRAIEILNLQTVKQSNNQTHHKPAQ